MPSRQQAKRKLRAIQNRKEQNLQQNQSSSQPAWPNPYDAEIIHLSYQSLGRLRQNYKPYQTIHHTLTAKLQHELKSGQFKRIALNPHRHTLIRGFDGSTIAYRVPSSALNLNHQLYKSIALLPRAQNHQHHGVNRGSHDTRYYCIWCPYSKEPCVSAHYVEDSISAKEFMDATQSLWDSMSNYLKEVFPSIYKEFTKCSLPNDLKGLSGAFMGCAINIGSEGTPVQTEPHRDVKERAFGVSCLCPFGEFEGGALILWELKLIIELAPGDLFFFPDSLIHHSNEEVKGVRHSIVAFTQQSVFAYWRKICQYKDRKLQHLRAKTHAFQKLKRNQK